MKNRLSSFWRRYIAWRLSYYRKLWFCKKYLKNHKEVLSASKSDAFRRFEFLSGEHFSISDPATALQVFDEIFVVEDYKMRESRESQVVFDVGANIGLFSLYAHMKQPNSRIFTIEANPGTFQILKKNIIENSLQTTVQIFNLALSAEIGKISFFSSPVSGWSSIFNLRGAQDGQQCAVDSINLSAFCKREGVQKIDFLKMDIEGAEYDAILGDSDFFEVPIKELVIEVDRQPRDQRYTYQDLINCLKCHYRSIKVVAHADLNYPLVYCQEIKSVVQR